MNETTERLLTDKIEEQERLIADLKRRLATAEDQSAGRIIRRLRCHGAILLHVGSDFDGYATAVQDEGFSGCAEDIIAETWPLETAPVSDGVKGSLRCASQAGMSKW